jgi:hypothetical protein
MWWEQVTMIESRSATRFIMRSRATSISQQWSCE